MIECDPVTFPKHFAPMPEGYRVVQLDSGHFLGLGPFDAKLGREAESSINVNRHSVRRWTFAHSKRTRGVDRPILWSAPMVLALLAGRKTQTRRLAKFAFKEGQNPDFSGYTPGMYFTGHPDTGYVLRSRGHGGCWNDRTEPLPPYALVGDRLWGRETWRTHERPDDGVDGVLFAADGTFQSIEPTAEAADLWVEAHDNGKTGTKWRPSIFMRRWMCRLQHEVTAVRVERLHDITEEDALAEGVEPYWHESWSVWDPACDATVSLMVEPTPADIAKHGYEDVRHIGPKLVTSARDAYRALWENINGPESWAANPWVWVVSFKPATR